MELGHYTNVAAPLVVDGIAEYFQCFDQLVSAEIARQHFVTDEVWSLDISGSENMLR